MSEITILTDPDRAVLDCAGIIAAVCPAYRSDTLLFSIEHNAIPLSDARALIAAWDRTQGALPELPPGYSVGKWDGGTDWYYRGPDGKIVYHWEENAGFKRWSRPACADAADATRRAWAHFAATLDPKWAQLLRNAGLLV